MSVHNIRLRSIGHCCSGASHRRVFFLILLGTFHSSRDSTLVHLRNIRQDFGSCRDSYANRVLLV